MIGGVYASLCTPFGPGGEIDLDGLASLVRFGLTSGVDGFLVNAIAGEVDELTTDERRATARRVLTEVDTAKAVIVGISTADDDTTALSLAREATDQGAACILIPARSANSDVSSVDFAAMLASSVDAEVMVQEAPRYSSASYGLPNLRRLADVLAEPPLIKVEGGGWLLKQVQREIGRGVSTWGGDGGMYLLECVRAGAAGVIPGVEVVDELVAAYLAESAGDPELGDIRLASVLPYLVFAMQSQARYVAAAKWILRRRGLIRSDFARLAGADLSDADTTTLSRLLDRLALDDEPAASSSPPSQPVRSGNGRSSGGEPVGPGSVER
jgi:dihydrodipicolinate synthase/N-acetylneuraminate lyase